MERKIVLPSKGVCNRLPGAVCGDGEMSDGVGLTFDGETVRPVQQPSGRFAVDGTLLVTHEVSSGKHYVYYDGSEVSWTDGTNGGGLDMHGGEEPLSATAVGNTLVISTRQGIVYHLWKGGAYNRLGSGIPQPEFRAVLRDTNALYSSEKGDRTGIIAKAQIKDMDAYRDFIAGLYAEATKRAHERKAFTRPFFVCCAVEMYDGTFTHVTNPVLLLPCIKDNVVGTISIEREGDPWTVRVGVTGCTLHCRQLTDFTDWEDIVRGVTVFVSEEVSIYDVNASECEYEERTDELLACDRIADRSSHLSYNLDAEPRFYRRQYSEYGAVVDTHGDIQKKNLYCMVQREADEIRKELSEVSTFYKLCDLGRAQFGVLWPTAAGTKFGAHTIENLTTQERLLSVDYHSFCPLGTDKQVYSFNRRLNLIGARRGFFEGFSQFMPYEKSHAMTAASSHTYYITVEIQTDSGTAYVKKTVVTRDIIAPTWFYYPDPRAKRVYINGHVFDLTEHRGLNGAYYMGELPTGIELPLSGGDTAPSATGVWEELENYVLQSDVDNPFVFNASGYVRVGQGEIIGLAALTTGLAQDVYSAATTLCFTTQGVWALTVDGEGRYARVSPPFSREVCNNWRSITMTDNAVFFTSEKGLMLVTGHRAQCVSGQLTGKVVTEWGGVREFLRGCRIAYDYRDGLLWIVNRDYAYHWLYNIASGTLTRVVDGKDYKAVVNDFPDTLFQDVGGTVYTLTGRPDMNDDTRRWDCRMITRPMKWGQGVALKSIRHLKHIMDVAEGSLTMKILTSNDCRVFTEVGSIRGRGFKYFVFDYEFKGLLSSDTFSGTVVDFETRETGKVR